MKRVDDDGDGCGTRCDNAVLLSDIITCKTGECADKGLTHHPRRLEMLVYSWLT